MSDIIYNETQWISYSTKCRRLLLVMIKRAQKHLSVKAAIIGDTSLNTFTKVKIIVIEKCILYFNLF